MEENWNDKEFMLEVVRKDVHALEYASEELKNDKNFILEVVKEDNRVMKYASEELSNDREFILEVVRENGFALEHIKSNLIDDEEIIKEAVDKGGYKYYIEDRIELSQEEKKQIEENGDYTLKNERFFKMLEEDKTINLIYLSQNLDVWYDNWYVYDNGHVYDNWYDMIVATTEIDERGISRIIDIIPVPVYFEKGGDWDRIQKIAEMDLDYEEERYEMGLNNGVYEWDIQSALMLDNLEKAKELMEDPEYIIDDVESFNKFVKGYLNSSEEWLSEDGIDAEYREELQSIIDKLKSYKPRTEEMLEEKHNIEEVEEAVSDRKMSDVNKATSEIVQANEEKIQDESNKEEHGEE